MWSQPPFAILHSFTEHLSFGSSWPAGQFTLPSHTLLFGMHIPPPQSNSVVRSHRLIGAAKSLSEKKVKFIRLEMWGFSAGTKIERERVSTVSVDYMDWKTYCNWPRHCHRHIQQHLSTLNGLEYKWGHCIETGHRGTFYSGNWPNSRRHHSDNRYHRRKAIVDRCKKFYRYTSNRLVGKWTKELVLCMCNSIIQSMRERVQEIVWCSKPTEELTTYAFIGTIATVGIAITFPLRCNANSIATLKIVIFAFLLWTIQFIAIISTVLEILRRNKNKNEHRSKI